MSPKKMGRPVVGSPKTNDIKVRVDNETNEKLEEYCKKNNLTKAEAIRQGIHLLLQK
ncbi:CopG family transcriptional regulator [Clostridioides sp. ZZV14-6150]|uniref:RepB family protein n=1 Tax=Clostridioides sp. ZZV14-6150 TaxID=2811493 RepID=UPI001D112824|nr:CopG family transcriptional regulator [Clostridioides sp. ZZV14-6150]